MTNYFRYLTLVWLGLFLWQCSIINPKHKINRSDKVVKIEVNHLEVEFSIESQNIETTDDFQAQATFTNKSNKDLKLNALFLGFSPILLKTEHEDGTPVPPGSPPFPPVDDGKAGRVVLGPGESKTYKYRGVDYFGVPLEDGKYRVRFRYENTITKYEDWAGTIETGWIDFEVKEPDAQS